MSSARIETVNIETVDNGFIVYAGIKQEVYYTLQEVFDCLLLYFGGERLGGPTRRATDGLVYCECPSCHASGLPELFIRRR